MFGADLVTIWHTSHLFTQIPNHGACKPVLLYLSCRTLVVTEETILHPSRNPHLSKDEKEHILKEYLGLEKIIW